MDFQRYLSSQAPRVRDSTTWNKIKTIELYRNSMPYKMAFGVPNPDIYPFLNGKVTLNDGDSFYIDPDLMRTMLSYTRMEGYKPLQDHLMALTKRLHNPPLWEDRSLIITNGSLDSISSLCRIFLDEGDTIIVPLDCYQGVFSACKHLQTNIASIETDEEDMIPRSLRETLSKLKGSKNTPKLLYVNPSGSNPCGTVMSESRRREIYDIACRYDLILVEDDPYYYIQFNDSPPPSFLQLDVEGRVIRLESFSKTVSAGIRLGFVIAPKGVNEILTHVVYSSYLHTSTFSQVLVCRLFDKWGVDKFLAKMRETRDLYRKLRDIVLEAADKHLKGLCEWRVPSGGLYLWLKVPKLKDTLKLLYDCGKNRDVLLLPGRGCRADQNAPSQFMRFSYSTINAEEVDKAFEILAEAIREEIQKESA